MKIGIVGWGVEGQSAYKFFGQENQYLIVNEHPRDDFPPESVKIKIQYLQQDKPAGVTGNVRDLSYLDGLQDCDKIIYTPTSRKNLEQHFGDNSDFWDKATTALDIFFETAKTKNTIGVTGTKGKGTTSTLIYRMLEAAGKTTYLGGNIGRSVLDFARDVQPDDWVVLELSSFQLYKFPYSPHIGVCLMIVPEHLDWHSDVNEYIEAKANLFAHQTPDDIAIYYDKNENSRRIAFRSTGLKIPYSQTPGASLREDNKLVIGEEETVVTDKSQIKLLGEHNLQNVCAAVTAVWQITQDVETIQEVLAGFSGLEHRLEFVRELDGVEYYDDSFGTTPETAIVALESFKQPKILILGGADKGSPFEELTEEVTKNNVRHAITIGDTGPKITALLQDRGFNHITENLSDMSSIVKAAREKAQSGDVVLLSTGCASFGLFHDYKDRGDRFKAAVNGLS